MGDVAAADPAGGKGRGEKGRVEGEREGRKKLNGEGRRELKREGRRELKWRGEKSRGVSWVTPQEEEEDVEWKGGGRNEEGKGVREGKRMKA